MFLVCILSILPEVCPHLGVVWDYPGVEGLTKTSIGMELQEGSVNYQGGLYGYFDLAAGLNTAASDSPPELTGGKKYRFAGLELEFFDQNGVSFKGRRTGQEDFSEFLIASSYSYDFYDE